MTDLLPPVEFAFVAATRKAGTAALTVLSPQAFATVRAKIIQWCGYDPTPLVALEALARRIGVGAALYKHKGPRFGLGSFTALGGSYAALRILQSEISRRLGQEVSLADIHTCKYRDEAAKITLSSANDGNHGRSLAWGCQRFGALVIRIECAHEGSVDLAKSETEANGWFVVSDTSWPGYSLPPRDVMAGYGVMARENCDTHSEVPTHVFLQSCVGGLAARVVAGLHQYWGDKAPRVVIVGPELAACLYEDPKAGRATSVAIQEETNMASLSCGEPSEMAWEILSEEASDFRTIPDAIVAPTVRLLARLLVGDPEVEAGESAVAGLAALIAARSDAGLSAKLGLDAASRVVLIGSEGVTDPAIFQTIVEARDAA